MTTNKPEVVAWKVRDEIFHSKEDAVEASAFHSRHCDLEPLIRLSDYEALRDECEELRKDAKRYHYIRKGNQWIVAATQTGAHLDGEVLDDLVDSEME